MPTIPRCPITMLIVPFSRRCTGTWGQQTRLKGPHWVYSILWIQFTSSSFNHEALLQQRNSGWDQSWFWTSTVGEGCCGEAGEVGGSTVTPPKVAARRASALSRGESVQESDVSNIGEGRAIMVVNRAKRRIRRWRKWFMIERLNKKIEDLTVFGPSW